MTAMRLAEHVAHTTDVDGMLESMSPEQFREWCAKDQIEPIGYQSQALGMICYLIHSYLCSSSDLTIDTFMPWLKHLPAPTAKSQNDKAKQLLKQVAEGVRHA